MPRKSGALHPRLPEGILAGISRVCRALPKEASRAAVRLKHDEREQEQRAVAGSLVRASGWATGTRRAPEAASCRSSCSARSSSSFGSVGRAWWEERGWLDL